MPVENNRPPGEINEIDPERIKMGVESLKHLSSFTADELKVIIGAWRTSPDGGDIMELIRNIHSAVPESDVTDENAA
jgi:hypothetical protein